MVLMPKILRLFSNYANLLRQFQTSTTKKLNRQYLLMKFESQPLEQNQVPEINDITLKVTKAKAKTNLCLQR